MTLNLEETKQERVLIIGAGFGGLELAKQLRNKNFQVVIIDRNNYHTFQPLLYQVATGGLEPNSIAYPIRKIFSQSKNVAFRMGEVTRILPEEQVVETNIGKIKYDYLVIATGSQSVYFNLAPVQHLLLPMKSLPDALNLRSYILQNFEKAAIEKAGSEREELINIALVGAGATGVELAGALAEMKRFVFPNDYPELDVSQMRISLYEAAPKVLSAMSEEASAKALQFLQEFGVEVHLNTTVESYDGSVLSTKDGKNIRTDTVIWTAGVKGKFPAGFGDTTIAPGNRLKVDEYNQLIGSKNIFAIGDAAAIIDEAHPKGHPMLAQVAMQQGRLLGKNLLALQKKESLVAFAYHDKGSMATVGRNRAVVDLPRWKFQGAFAWLVWMFVHIFSLVGFRNKLRAFWDWMYNFLTYDRAMRMIIRTYNRPETLEDKIKNKES